ncbi:MAG: pyridoxamine kinase [Fusicatenibacter sp.]|nr:pyridoxamine kinase [Lachnospiraceae bacterium]MDY2938677.1 pyridoxamine kinase [Fusicatenibacter sp.]
MRRDLQKKMAVINDFTGFGRCSLTVSIPIISHMGIQCCPVPTSIFSNHTAFPSYYFDDYTDKMSAYIKEWDKMDLSFDGILTGFLGSESQIQIVTDFIRRFRTENTCVIIDPVMGDNGRPYTTFTPELCQAMGTLARQADLLTPNLTEACILTGTPYQNGQWKQKDLFALADALGDLGIPKAVISGIPCGTYIGNLIWEQGKEPRIIRSKKVGQERCGTGDLFASILASDAVNGINLCDSVKKASAFVRKCITATEICGTPLTDGVCFETQLSKLRTT